MYIYIYIHISYIYIVILQLYWMRVILSLCIEQSFTCRPCNGYHHISECEKGLFYFELKFRPSPCLSKWSLIVIQLVPSTFEWRHYDAAKCLADRLTDPTASIPIDRVLWLFARSVKEFVSDVIANMFHACHVRYFSWCAFGAQAVTLLLHDVNNWKQIER